MVAVLRRLLPATAIVLGLRGLYLARFGWDGCWMNYNFLAEAKNYALGRVGEAHGLPLTPLVLWVSRAVGLSPLAALGAVYLVAQALFTIAALVLFRFFAPEASPRRRLCFLLLLAVVPMLSVDTGYKDLAVTLGAGLMLAALACALPAAARDRAPVGVLAAAAVFAALGGMCRLEAAAGTGLAGALLLARRGGAPQPHPLPRSFPSALVLLGGTGLGLALTAAISWRLRGTAQISSATYSFYTFYDGLPYLMRLGPAKLPGEYGRYLSSVDTFGSFVDNHGSLLSALLAHPGSALLRFLLKVPDLVAGASGFGGITPVGVALAVVGVVAGARSGAVASSARAKLLLAFVGPLCVLFVPPASNFYFLAVLFPVLLVMAAGLDFISRRLSERAIRLIFGSSLVVAAALIAGVGRTERSSSATINQAARFLEAECRSGCLVNYLPQALSAQAWTDLEAGAPFPEKIKRSEPFVFGRHPTGYQQACSFDERVRRARARGYAGPILYVGVDVASAPTFNDLSDPEHRFEGDVDLSGSTLRRRFEANGDSIDIHQLMPAGRAATR